MMNSKEKLLLILGIKQHHLKEMIEVVVIPGLQYHSPCLSVFLSELISNLTYSLSDFLLSS